MFPFRLHACQFVIIGLSVTHNLVQGRCVEGPCYALCGYWLLNLRRQDQFEYIVIIYVNFVVVFSS